MADKDGAQAAFLVERFFEGKNAKHQVEVAGHLRDASAIPRPDLGTDVVDGPDARQLCLDRFGEAQIEPRIINEDERIRLKMGNVREHPVELRLEVTVLFQHVPEAHHGFIRPIGEVRAAERPHFAPSGAEEFESGIVRPQSAHQFGAAGVAAGFPCDQVEFFSHGLEMREWLIANNAGK